MKDLTVEIPRKYKKALLERFSLKNARKGKSWMWKIKKPCPLCKKYFNKSGKWICEECPFFIFDSAFSLGCLNWINDLIDTAFIEITFDEIDWYTHNDKQARKELKLLKKKAKELIKWV